MKQNSVPEANIALSDPPSSPSSLSSSSSPYTPSSPGRGTLLVLISAVSFGLMPIFTKLAYENMSFPTDHRVKTVLVIRFVTAAICMWLIWLLQGRQTAVNNRRVTLREFIPLVAMGAIGYVGQSFSYFTALGSISASATGLLLYTYPILVTLLAWLLLREHMDRVKLVSLGLATIGALMVLNIFSSVFFGGPGLGTLNPTGVFWGLSAAAIYSVYIIAGARFTPNISPIFASSVIITSAACVYTVWGFLAGEIHLDLTLDAWFWSIMIATVCTVVAIVTFFAGLSTVGPSRAAIVSTLEPAVTVLLAAPILHEATTVEQLLGGALILCAVLLLQIGHTKL
jgi:drug/metabolite transporter (DMT)-like permease